MEGRQRLAAELVTADVIDPIGTAASANNIARALNGRLGRRAGE
jgi:hypothetical protein